MKRCHHCNSDQHLIRDCEQAKRNQNTQGTRPVFQKSRVNQIQVMSTEEVVRRNRYQGSKEMWSEFKAKSSRDNARANHLETSNQER